MQQVCALGLDHSRLLLIYKSIKGDEMNSENKTQFNNIMTDSGDSLILKNEGLNRKPIHKKATDNHIGIVIEINTREEVKHFRKLHYRDIYPDMNLDNDVLDDIALTLYTRNEIGLINSTARLSVDGPPGLPQDLYLEKYREQGASLMELGRFIIDRGNMKLLKSYYSTFYSVAQSLQIDAIVMSMQPRHIRFHQKLIGIRVVAEDTENYGGPYSLACVVWEVKQTSSNFFQWLGEGYERT